ncbi:MAG TPA: histidine kinase [Actinocrinis sp.]|jgi:two-component system sensor histidine kinase DesK
MAKLAENDGRPGTPRRAGWLYAGVWLVYLLIPISNTMTEHLAAWRQAVAWAGLAVFVITYILMVLRSQLRERVVFDLPVLSNVHLLIVAAVLAAAMPLLVSSDWYALWVYVAAACGAVLPYDPQKWALVGGILATAAMAAECTALGVQFDNWGWVLLPALFSCVAPVGIRRMRTLIAELEKAREEVRHLATNQERLRLARDLHDLAGHSMATITLKAELAGRLIGRDDAAAARQVAEIETVSRTALSDIREAVSGYRRATLAVETASARTALSAAGIEFEHDPALLFRSGRIDPEAEAALAWCLREAVTNVVRHSGASHCTARLIEATVDGETSLTLEVADDGACTAAAAEGEDGAAQVRPRGEPVWGNGLTGLRERLAPFSASLHAAPMKPNGFRLSATIPVG